MITHDRLLQILHYDPDAGFFTWREKISKKVVVGRRAGSINVAGYRVIGIDGALYYAHRLAWLYMTGAWPPADIDHRHGDLDDNRWSEIRAATPQQNGFNARTHAHNTSGFKGVSWHKAAGKWSASVTIGGRKKHLGLHETPESAHTAYVMAVGAIEPEFVREK